jgi:leader peptidase (prepilin peptidase)/N-methyltransferase
MAGPALTEGIFALLTGACAGSFVTMASHRIPRGEEIIFTPSHCPSCDTALRAPDLFPVLSWAIRKGRCRYCGVKVGARYPLTELATALGFFAVWLQFGFTWMALVMALLVTLLMILIVVDFEHQIIPDTIQVALLLLCVPYHLLRHDGWTGSLTGAALGLTIGLTLRYGYLYLRKLDALGMGDVKFLFVAGAWLGTGALVMMLFIAGATGTLLGIAWKITGRGPRFPFGPSLAAALYICVAAHDYFASLIWLQPLYQGMR